MSNSVFLLQRLACAYFFVIPALAYGTLTSRLPALGLAMGADDGAIGTALLGLGISTLCGLFACNYLIERYGARKITAFSAIYLAAAFSAASILPVYWQFTLFCVLGGLGVGLCDVGMNALGISLERSSKILSLAFLHACSSIGGAIGSISGSICANFAISPFWNFLIIFAIWLVFWPWAFVNLPEDETGSGTQISRGLRAIPVLVIICGLLSLLCHIVEGSTAEWGSLLLATVKNAPQQEAALVFASFTIPMVMCRLFSDRLRSYLSDASMALAGSGLAATGMCVVLLSPWPELCLCGYAMTGLGIAPLTPLLFSRAGAVANISAGKASAVVSLLSYSGLLLFPPFFGFLAEWLGLANALWLIPAICAALAWGSRALKTRSS